MKHRIIKIDQEQVHALSNATRLEIHTALRLDGPATAKELAERMSVSELSLYYHLRLLARLGLIDATQRPGATKPETVYSVEARYLVEGIDLSKKAALDAEVKNIDSLLRAVSREHRQSATEKRNDFYNSSFISRSAVRLNAKDSKELRRKLKELNKWMDEHASPQGDRYSVSMFVIPLTDRP